MKLLHELHSQTKKKKCSLIDLKEILWSYVMLFLLYYKEENSALFGGVEYFNVANTWWWILLCSSWEPKKY